MDTEDGGKREDLQPLSCLTSPRERALGRQRALLCQADMLPSRGGLRRSTDTKELCESAEPDLRQRSEAAAEHKV